MRFYRLVACALVLCLTLSLFIPPSAGAEGDSPIVIEPVNPLMNGTVPDGMPTIIINYSSPAGIDTSKVFIVVDDTNMTLSLATTRNEYNVTVTIPDTLALKNGDHTVTVYVADKDGKTNMLVIHFYVGERPVPAPPFNAQEFAIKLLMVIGVGLIGLGVVVLYLRKTRKFTFKKFFTRHPVPKAVFVGIIPVVAALFFVLFSVALFQGDPKTAPYSSEFIVVTALFIALLPYAIYAYKEKSTIARYERAFSQFLFEMSDAMRGGIDPAKALVELSKTDTGILGKHLRIAANGIEMGRPFEEMINVMVKPIKSKLIKRYASLIGESAKVGGEISLVVHRAAKDMDDLIKIEQERSRSLMGQATTIYIAFGVMLVIIYQLISIYPSLGSVDFSAIGGGLNSTSSSTVTAGKMSFVAMKKNFLDLVIVNSVGNGLLIGLFTQGKMKYGLLHSLIMVLASMVFFLLMIL
jgi:archaellum biogenesis protein FlaJ (TadC family)